MAERFWIETLGCPKNQVDSDKIVGALIADGLQAASGVEQADVVVVNTCAFIDAARQESIDTILDLSSRRRSGSRLVVTGCLAARAGEELAASLPEVDLVANVGVPIKIGNGDRWRPGSARSSLDLLELARPPASAPWAYVKIAEGCDRACGFCAIPSFRGPQRSRSVESIVAEVENLGVVEVVLVAQDLASYGRDIGSPGALVDLVRLVSERVERVRLLYLYPSSLNDRLINAIVDTGLSYFDLSLQHASGRLLRGMRRFGSGDRFLDRIERIRDLAPDAALRSSFILGYPGELEEDHDELLEFLERAQLDWAGFFVFSEEEATVAAKLEDKVPRELALERMREASELQDAITASKREALVGTMTSVLVDAPGVARSHREAPEIDGVVRVPKDLSARSTYSVVIQAAEGPDLWAELADQSNGAVA